MDFWAAAWKYGWADKATMQEAVRFGCITADDYKTITGEDYTTPVTGGNT